MSNRTDVYPLSLSDRVVNKTVFINTSPVRVWEFLTIPKLMQKWMFSEEIDILTDWQVGSPIVIRGVLHGVPFENKGIILQFEPERVLTYSHLSSASHLSDEPASYSIIEFRLAAVTESQTALTLNLSHFPTPVIYKHLAYYWNVTLELIKRKLEEAD